MDAFGKIRYKLNTAVNSRVWSGAASFAESPYYLIIPGVFACLSGIFGLDIMGITVCALASAFAFVFCKNPLNAYFSVVLVSTCVSNKNLPKHATFFQSPYYCDPKIYGTLIALFVILFIAYVFSLICYKRVKPIAKRRQLSLPLLVVFAALVLGGCFSPYTYSPLGFVIGLCYFAPYALIMGREDIDGKTAMRSFCMLMTVLGTLAAIQLLHFELTTKEFLQLMKEGNYGAAKGLISLGWTGSNTTGTTIMMSMPFVLYLAQKSKMPIFYLVLAVFDALIGLMTFSRASMIVMIPLVAVISVYVFFRAKNKVVTRAFFAFTLLAVPLVLYSFRNELSHVFGFFLESGFADRGRFALWDKAIENFKLYPEFGVGFTLLPKAGYPYHSYHNTLLSFLASCGIVGLVADLYHRVSAFAVIFKNISEERLFIFGGIFGLMINGFLDICMTNPFHVLFYSIMLAIAETDLKNGDTLSGKEKTLSGSYWKFLGANNSSN